MQPEPFFSLYNAVFSLTLIKVHLASKCCSEKSKREKEGEGGGGEGEGIMQIRDRALMV